MTAFASPPGTRVPALLIGPVLKQRLARFYAGACRLHDLQLLAIDLDTRAAQLARAPRPDDPQWAETMRVLTHARTDAQNEIEGLLR